MRASKKPTLALDSSIVQDNVPQEILPGIFIGSIHAAFNQEALLEQGITHILNASRIPATFPKQFTYLSIDIRDKEDANILSCIPASNIFIEAGMDSGGVLVHCFGGRSRSAAFVVAFLMSSHEWTYEQALMTVMAARPVAGINKGFERQLRAYGATAYDVYASQQVLLLHRIRALHALRRANVQEREREREASGTDSSPASTGSGSSGHKRGYQWNGVAMNAAEEDGEEEEEVEEGERLGMMLSAEGGGIATSAGSMIPLALPLPLSLLPHSSMTSHKAAHAEQFDSFTSLPLHAARMGVVGPGPGPGSGGGSSSGAGPVGSRSASSSPRAAAAGGPIVSEGPAPHVRLTRPGSSSVRVIPPLRGLERRYCCSWCGADLFSLASVVRLDLLRAERERERERSHGPRRDTLSLSALAEDKHASAQPDCAQHKGFFPTMPPPTGSPKSGMRVSPLASAGQGPRFFPAEEKAAAPAGAFPSTLTPAGFNRFAAGGGLQTSRHRDSKGAKGGFDFMDTDDVDGAGAGRAVHENGHDRARDGECKAEGGQGAGLCAKDGGGRDEGESDATPRLSVPPSRDHFRSSTASSSSWSGAYAPSSSSSSSSSFAPANHNPMGPAVGPPALTGYPFRPQSAERKRWLDRVNLLRSSAGGAAAASAEGKLHKIALVAAKDYSAGQSAEVETGGKYLHLEYCSWMGTEPLRGLEEEGHINCRECKKAIGLWSWQPSDRQCLDGLLEPPLFRVLKDSVSQTPLALDATPTSTPRLEEDKQTL